MSHGLQQPSLHLPHSDQPAQLATLYVVSSVCKASKELEHKNRANQTALAMWRAEQAEVQRMVGEDEIDGEEKVMDW